MQVKGSAFKTGKMYASIGLGIQNRDNVYMLRVLLLKSGKRIGVMSFAFKTGECMRVMDSAFKTREVHNGT